MEIEIPKAGKCGPPKEDYEAHIKVIDDSDLEKVRWTGCLHLGPKRSAVV